MKCKTQENVRNLFAFMMQFSKDKDQVANWVQNAFIKAFNNINSFSGSSKFSTWLFKIAINEMKSENRKLSSKYFIRIDEKIEKQEPLNHNVASYKQQNSNNK